jgi:hypothetical protein
LDRPKKPQLLRIALELPERFRNKPTQVTLLIDNALAASEITTEAGELFLEAPMQPADAYSTAIVILCNRYFIPALQGENEDDRLLSTRLVSLEFHPASR